MHVKCILFLVFLHALQPVNAQTVFTYFDPVKDSNFNIQGLGWKGETTNPFDRLPARAESSVSKPLWSLSRHTAGASIVFATDASEIIVRYKVSGNLQMSHMPATGVSGVDLYIHHDKNKWLWCPGKYSFRDTIVYRFLNIDQQQGKTRKFHLYLPLYNGINWIEIGLPEKSLLAPVKITSKPIVVFGTSIAQGACASRPGLAWTSILSRELNRPVINLGFSGNGKLQKEIIELLAELDASLYILDCMPNLMEMTISSQDLKSRITGAVNILHNKKPGIPVLITAHPGYPDELINKSKKSVYINLNETIEDAFKEINNQKKFKAWILSREELNIGMESTVDGTHPNDHGMFEYAKAYKKKILSIAIGQPPG